MKQIIQIIVVILIFIAMIFYSAVCASAATPVFVGSSDELLDDELPPDIFDENCDGGATCLGRIFVDMPSSTHWSHVPIDWALARHITSGTSPNTFSPGNGCTRAQAVTFLWRANGAPEPENVECPFVDVPDGAYYFKAVLWAVENHITSGTSETTFSPGNVCTRAQIVMFLWRSKGSPISADSSVAFPFQDVSEGAYYRNAVIWAIEKGITSGTSQNTFSPNLTCTRAQIVTFLYKAIHG